MFIAVLKPLHDVQIFTYVYPHVCTCYVKLCMYVHCTFGLPVAVQNAVESNTRQGSYYVIH